MQLACHSKDGGAGEQGLTGGTCSYRELLRKGMMVAIFYTFFTTDHQSALLKVLLHQHKMHMKVHHQQLKQIKIKIHMRINSDNLKNS